MCLSASGRLVVNNAHCMNWQGDVHVGNENSVLSIAMLMVSSSRWGSFFGVVESDLRVKLTEL